MEEIILVLRVQARELRSEEGYGETYSRVVAGQKCGEIDGNDLADVQCPQSFVIVGHIEKRLAAPTRRVIPS